MFQQIQMHSCDETNGYLEKKNAKKNWNEKRKSKPKTIENPKNK